MFKLLNIGLISFFIILLSSCGIDVVEEELDNRFITHEVNPHEENLKMYWKNPKGKNYRNAKNLKNQLEKKGETLLFAVNGGMYNKQDQPLGLYIEKGETRSKLDITTNKKGNFYMQPNGVFFLRKDKHASIVSTQNFKASTQIQYATQSGPMLLIDGSINPLFGETSSNLNIRNGVGILPNGNVFFVQSKVKVNFYEFTQVFKEKGCENALYLDGYVSRTYLPEKNWEQLDGDFAVIIAVTE
jgi:uncharacterized protein YigE (DUF2233 family)